MEHKAKIYSGMKEFNHYLIDEISIGNIIQIMDEKESYHFEIIKKNNVDKILGKKIFPENNEYGIINISEIYRNYGIDPITTGEYSHKGKNKGEFKRKPVI